MDFSRNSEVVIRSLGLLRTSCTDDRTGVGSLPTYRTWVGFNFFISETMQATAICTTSDA